VGRVIGLKDGRALSTICSILVAASVLSGPSSIFTRFGFVTNTTSGSDCFGRDDFITLAAGSFRQALEPRSEHDLLSG